MPDEQSAQHKKALLQRLLQGALGTYAGRGIHDTIRGVKGAVDAFKNYAREYDKISGAVNGPRQGQGQPPQAVRPQASKNMDIPRPMPAMPSNQIPNQPKYQTSLPAQFQTSFPALPDMRGVDQNQNRGPINAQTPETGYQFGGQIMPPPEPPPSLRI